ncbi:threonine/serine exporter [Opitutaceae bacterium TAV4]|nr:threonine/serine exporter [Opitutaceae bacterium TAV4]RRJ99510.1 threonine/serine exporter [Opitutaceae bacterium TAV3]RRJ99593.1 threonine/serine exporter [Opitutaceae bacterium TAV3]
MSDETTSSLNPSQENVSVEQFADMALDVGVFLLASGAHCGRVFSNIKRLADRWGFPIHINPTFTGLTITVRDGKQSERTVTRYQDAPPHSVHLAILTLFSRLSWQVLEDRLPFDLVKQRIEEIKAKANYSFWLVALAVGAACASLCMLAGGDARNALCTFVAAFTGSVLRIGILKMRFNPMISFVVAAFVTTLIAGIDTIWHIGTSPEATLATAVLYLIPGVPLINSVIDLIEGYLASALSRGLFAAFILLCIASGMTLAITLLGIENF